MVAQKRGHIAVVKALKALMQCFIFSTVLIILTQDRLLLINVVVLSLLL